MAGRISNENSIEVMTLHSNYLIKYKYLSIWVEDIVRRFVLFTQQLASMSQLTFELWKLVAFWLRHSNILNEIIWCYGSKSHSTYFLREEVVKLISKQNGPWTDFVLDVNILVNVEKNRLWIRSTFVFITIHQNIKQTIYLMVPFNWLVSL